MLQYYRAVLVSKYNYVVADHVSQNTTRFEECLPLSSLNNTFTCQLTIALLSKTSRDAIIHDYIITRLHNYKA